MPLTKTEAEDIYKVWPKNCNRPQLYSTLNATFQYLTHILTDTRIQIIVFCPLAIHNSFNLSLLA